MKCLILINKKFPLKYQDKTVYFDTENDAVSFIDACRQVNIASFATLDTQLIEDSEIDEKYINYRDVTIM